MMSAPRRPRGPRCRVRRERDGPRQRGLGPHLVVQARDEHELGLRRRTDAAGPLPLRAPTMPAQNVPWSLSGMPAMPAVNVAGEPDGKKPDPVTTPAARSSWSASKPLSITATRMPAPNVWSQAASVLTSAPAVPPPGRCCSTATGRRSGGPAG